MSQRSESIISSRFSVSKIVPDGDREDYLYITNDKLAGWEKRIFKGDEVDATLGDLLLGSGCTLLLDLNIIMDRSSKSVSGDTHTNVISYDTINKLTLNEGVVHVDDIEDKEWTRSDYGSINGVIVASGAKSSSITVYELPDGSKL